MKRRNVLAGLLIVPVAASVLVLGEPAAGAPGTAQATADYTVLIEQSASRHDAVAAISAAGGTVIKENAALGALTVRAPAAGFAQQVSASGAVSGATRVRPIGRVPDASAGAAPGTTPDNVKQRDDAATEHNSNPSAAPAGRPQVNTAAADPLDNLRWGLRMVRTPQAHDHQIGDRRVLVGVLDTGVDATHPDIAPNINLGLSRNFTVDIPYDETGAEIDGPCEFRGCVDPPGYDDYGSGTHVAGTIAAAANGFGVSGVAPGITLVSIRGAQDSGYIFLQPVLDALTYGADIGLDVINMGFYLDPWLYNCPNNPADSPQQQLEQRTTIEAVNRALDYAHRHGVTLLGALGNNHEDLGHPRPDLSSPDYPTGAAHPRIIDNATCRDLPVEGNHVIGVAALGPSGVKTDYTNYGVEQTSVSAPGGYFRDYLGTPWHNTNENLILSSYPRNVALANGYIDADGNLTPAGVAAALLRYCDGITCGYYRYSQGTSMATSHASGVAALVVSQYGRRDGRTGLTMNPDQVERVLITTAFKHPCPTPRLFSYADVGRPPEYDALCEGTTQFNGFYGHGIVDAFAAVTRGGHD